MRGLLVLSLSVHYKWTHEPCVPTFCCFAPLILSFFTIMPLWAKLSERGLSVVPEFAEEGLEFAAGDEDAAFDGAEG